MKIKELWRQLGQEFAPMLPEPEQEAKAAEAKEMGRLLLAFVLHCQPKELLFKREESLSPKQEEQFFQLWQKAKAGYPVQYLTGEQEFMSLPFAVGEGTLIPRWETELLVERALCLFPKDKPIVAADICAGSGAIGVSLCHYLPCCYCFGVDISEQALAYAKENSRKNQVAERMTWLQGDLLTPLLEQKRQYPDFQLDLILSNPPYVTEAEMADLPENVRYEPALALYGGKDGLDFYKRLAAESPALLKEGGWLGVECGCNQGQAVADLWHEAGFVQVEIGKDYAGKDRMVWGRKQENQEKQG